MSLYNMIFGQNPLSHAILATLGLTVDDVGRFRDCFIADGEICVYTRNGGGNRGECWHRSKPNHGNKECKHHVIQEEADVYAFMPEAEWPNGKAPGNWHCSEGGVYGCRYRTGERRMEDRFVCEEPDSEACTCPACVVNYRLPKHPCYLRDTDDDFDCTYCTVYFRFPDEFAEELKKLESGESFDPSKRWLDALEAIKTATVPQ